MKAWWVSIQSGVLDPASVRGPGRISRYRRHRSHNARFSVSGGPLLGKQRKVNSTLVYTVHSKKEDTQVTVMEVRRLVRILDCNGLPYYVFDTTGTS